MVEKRHPIAVVMEMKKIPDLPDDVFKDLDWYIEDFSYKAPEQVGFCFERLNMFVWETLDIDQNGCKNPQDIIDTPWKLSMLSLLSTVPEDKLRELVRAEIK